MVDSRAAILTGAKAAHTLHRDLGTREQVERSGGGRIDVFGVIAKLGATLMFQPLDKLLGAFLPGEEVGVLITTKRPLHSRVVGQAKRFSREIAEGVKQASGVLEQLALESLRQQLDAMVPLVKQVMKQARARIFRGDTRSQGKLLSVFEPSTEVIRKGKAAKPNEFGKMVKLQEAENQIVIDYEVYARRPNDSDLLIAAIETHQANLGRTPRLVAADAAFYSSKNEATAKEKGVKRVCIPNRATKSAERKREQKKRWFRNGQKWRTGCEGRISVVKRRHGLNRCRYKGDAGIQRWVGLGVIADNLVNIGRAMKKRAAT
jgi:transposase, IS5 family